MQFRMFYGFPILKLFTIVMGILLIFSIVSCSDSGDAETAGGDNANVYPITVETSTGEFTLDSEPQRILTLQNVAYESVVALGKSPVAAAVPEKFFSYPYYDGWKDKEFVTTDISVGTGKVDIEGIAKESPDFIIAPAWPAFTEEPIKSQLTDIAPTLFFDTQSQGVTWVEGFKQVAKILNSEERASDLIGEYYDNVAKAKVEHPNISGRTFSFGRWNDGGVLLSGSGNSAFTDLGLVMSNSQSSLSAGGANLSYREYSSENVGSIDGDVLYLAAVGDRESIERSSSFAHIKDRVIWADENIGNAVNNAGVLGNLWLPKELAKSLDAG